MLGILKNICAQWASLAQLTIATLVLLFATAISAHAGPTSSNSLPDSDDSAFVPATSAELFFVVVRNAGHSAWANLYAFAGGDPVNREDPTGLDWEWTQDNSVELNKGHWEYIPGTDITVPQPLPTFAPQNNGGSSQFTWGDAGNLMGFYAERGVKTTNPDVKDMYAGALSDIDELASLSTRIGQADAAGMQSTIDNTAALITARERLGAHLASGQATEDYYVGQINAFNPRKVPLIWATLTALHVAGTITAPLEVPLTDLSAPGVINAPLPGAKQVGAAALVLSKLPRALVGLERAGNVAVQAERMMVPLFSTPGRSVAANARVPAAYQAAENRLGAWQFYKSKGWSDERITGHLMGIDFTKPVVAVVIPKGTTLGQWQVAGGRLGTYFSWPGTAPTTIGISGSGKIETIYIVPRSRSALQSTAASVLDTWSGPLPVQTSGGAVRFFSPGLILP